MGWITALAIFFVIWWTVLFAILPIGMRSQIEDDDVILGTAHSAPTNFSPRTPVGPSENAIGARPSRSSPCRVKTSAPVRSRTLSSSGRVARASSLSTSSR